MQVTSLARIFVLLGTLVWLGGCGPDESATGTPPKAPEAAARTSQRPAKLTVGVSSLGTAEAWLPWLEAGREGWIVLEPIYESLVAVNARTGQYEPQLAEKIVVEDEGRRWRFVLRRGIKFHDGQSEVTAEDVKFSYEMSQSDKAVASMRSVMQSLVERVDVVGPHEIVFQLKRPEVTFLGLIAPGYFGIVSKNYVERVGASEAALKPVGTGPYRLVEHRRQESVTFGAVPQHWRETGRFKSLVIRRIPDQSARLAMLRAGEIDITEIPFKLKREVDAAGLQILRIPGAAIYHVQLGGQVLPTRETFDPTVPWVGDPKDPASQERALKVRQAMNLAVDKRAVADAVFEGEGVPGVAPYFLPGTEFVPPGIKPYDYNPREAKRLLGEAGYAQGFSREIEMLLMPWPGRAEMADVAEVVAGFWERNLELKIRRKAMDFATYAPSVGAPRKSAWVTWAHGYTPRPLSEPIISMQTWLPSTARYNSVIEKPEIDALSIKIRAEVDRAKRVEDYRALARMLFDGYYGVPIAAVPALYAYNPKVLKEWLLLDGDAYLSGYERAIPAQ
jgi:peptide/nickel transport system substrate-binding protein